MNVPDQAYKHFMSIYTNVFHNCFPITRLKLNKKYHKLEPWMSTGLMASMKTKTQLLKKKLKQPTELNINNYKAYINVYSSLKTKLKMKYYSNIIDENKLNMKKTWKTLIKVIGKTSNKSNFPLSFNIGNKTVTDKPEISKSFNA